MKTINFGYTGTLLLGCCLLAPCVHAAGGDALKLSSAEALQQRVQISMQQMIEGSMEQMMRDSIRHQPAQPGMLIRLTDEMPTGLEEYLRKDATGNLSLENQLPQSSIPASRGNLG